MIRRGWALLLLCATMGASTGVRAEEPQLQRRPGWWLLDIRTEVGASRPMPQAVHICTDPAVDRVQTPFGVHMGPGCPPVRVTRAGGGWDVAASCKVGATDLSATGRLTGDLASAYHVDLVTRLAPAPAPGAGEVKIGIDARWLGACPAGKSPGDVDLSMSLNVAPPAGAPPAR